MLHFPMDLTLTFVYETYIKQTANCYEVFKNEPVNVFLYPLLMVIAYRSIFAYFFPTLFYWIAWVETLILLALYTILIVSVMVIGSIDCVRSNAH